MSSSDSREPVTTTGPVFISYRHSDGTDTCAELAWLLRAAGIPVWRDVDDLPPGDTDERLKQAINDGLSGGVLVVTNDVQHSRVIQNIEAPALIALHRQEPLFALGIVNNAAPRAGGGTDYTAPDRLLVEKAGTLSGVDQRPGTRDGLLAVVRGILGHRMRHLREQVADRGAVLDLTVQTRNAPQVYDRSGYPLDIRLRPPEADRLPHREALRDLQDTIALLPGAVVRAGATRVRIRGGAHLSVAFALGAALPSSRVGVIEVVDQRDESWTSSGEPCMPASPKLEVVDEATAEQPRVSRPVRPAVAAYLDLIAHRSDAAFQRYLDEHRHELAAWRHFRPIKDRLLDPREAGTLASEAAACIRELSATHQNAEIHLLLRCPFPLAILVGRLTNSLRVVTYEWDDSDDENADDHRPTYVATMRVRASATDGVIREVLAPISHSDAAVRDPGRDAETISRTSPGHRQPRT